MPYFVIALLYRCWIGEMTLESVFVRVTNIHLTLRLEYLAAALDSVTSLNFMLSSVMLLYED